MKNYYDVLEVSRKASKDTINKIFKIHMKANHPDLFQGEEKIKAEEKSKELTEAYNVLSDDNERAKYDAELDAEESSNSVSNEQLNSILEENEYLRQVIAKKDEYITMLTGNAPQYQNNYNGYGNNYSNYNNNYAQSPNYSNQNYYQQQNNFTQANNYARTSNPYENMTAEDLKKIKKEETKAYYLDLAKEWGVKILITILIIVALLISLGSSFKDLQEILRK